MEKNKHDVLKKIVHIEFPIDQYIRKRFPKTQVVLHHTVSGDNPKAVARYWASRPNRVATCIIIARDGTPYQLFSSRFWGGHIGNTLRHFNKFGVPYSNLNHTSIGVELCTWGGLQEIDNKIVTCYGNTLDKEKEDIRTLDMEYRGYTLYHSYTSRQIATLEQLLLFWNDRYKIPLDYQKNMWKFNRDALSGKPGIWSHTSFRPDKSDLFPQEEVIEMLKNLKDKI